MLCQLHPVPALLRTCAIKGAGVPWLADTPTAALLAPGGPPLLPVLRPGSRQPQHQVRPPAVRPPAPAAARWAGTGMAAASPAPAPPPTSPETFLFCRYLWEVMNRHYTTGLNISCECCAACWWAATDEAASWVPSPPGRHGVLRSGRASFLCLACDADTFNKPTATKSILDCVRECTAKNGA